MASIRKLTIELLRSSHISENGRASVIWRKLWPPIRGCGSRDTALLVTSLTTAANCSGVSPGYFLNLPDSARVEQPGCEQSLSGREDILCELELKYYEATGSWDARPASRVGNLVNE